MTTLPTIMRRVGMTIVYHLLNTVHRVVGKDATGVTALVITPAGRIVLVRHSYMAGWYLPGGGLKRGETPRQGVMRELSEEIGLLRWTAISQSDQPFDPADPRCTGPAPFIVTGAEYRFHPSLEIEEAREFAPEALPDNCPASVKRHVAWWQAGTALALPHRGR
jgi:8-oxo-dGTP pyrophosphatase MutT (NUDIX family)